MNKIAHAIEFYDKESEEFPKIEETSENHWK